MWEGSERKLTPYPIASAEPHAHLVRDGVREKLLALGAYPDVTSSARDKRDEARPL